MSALSEANKETRCYALNGRLVLGRKQRASVPFDDRFYWKAGISVSVREELSRGRK